mmetsp:Transcript_110091/g.322049  ORF Transcript_110091/g.322049 Transcript_110091/m.322049 type:complete len:257 (-) Transcript_110091:1568-2338(-)
MPDSAVRGHGAPLGLSLRGPPRSQRGSGVRLQGAVQAREAPHDSPGSDRSGDGHGGEDHQKRCSGDLHDQRALRGRDPSRSLGRPHGRAPAVLQQRQRQEPAAPRRAVGLHGPLCHARQTARAGVRRGALWPSQGYRIHLQAHSGRDGGQQGQGPARREQVPGGHGHLAPPEPPQADGGVRGHGGGPGEDRVEPPLRRNAVAGGAAAVVYRAWGSAVCGGGPLEPHGGSRARGPHRSVLLQGDCRQSAHQLRCFCP